MTTHGKAEYLVVLVSLLVCLVPSQAFSHGVMLVPPSRAIGAPNEDYQYCFGTAGCECGEFPEVGETAIERPSWAALRESFRR